MPNLFKKEEDDEIGKLADQIEEEMRNTKQEFVQGEKINHLPTEDDNIS